MFGLSISRISPPGNKAGGARQFSEEGGYAARPLESKRLILLSAFVYSSFFLCRLGGLNHLAEGIRVTHGQIGQHFAVQHNIAAAHLRDQLAVGGAI